MFDSSIDLPLVSVIVPNYNYARYLNNRLDTILNQTYQHFELIILDDSSTDNSRDVIESYRGNPHISHIVYNKTNSGSTFKQWKRGLDMVRGDFVWIAEADDYADVAFLESLVPIFHKYKDVGMVYCYSLLVDQFNSLIEDIQSPFVPEWKRESFFRGTQFIASHLSRETHPRNVSSALFSVNILKKIILNPIYQDMRIAGDRMFYILVSEISNVVYVNEKLNYYRKSSTSITPRLMLDGTSMRENYVIDKYLRNNKYMVGWNSLLTWCNRFHNIYYHDYDSEQTRRDLLRLYDPLGLMSRTLLKLLSFLVILKTKYYNKHS